MAPRIVVGVDGSPGATVALRWARAEAGLRGATLDVVHAWHEPYVGGIPGMGPYGISFDELERAARAELDRAIGHAGPPPPGVRVEPILAPGPAAAVLLEAAKGADLLVVGSRGRGGFTGLLLGSVGQQCVHHAPCPVVVVPVPDDDR
jgi:nucleotide-binding universal stress UspA family protein